MAIKLNHESMNLLKNVIQSMFNLSNLFKTVRSMILILSLAVKGYLYKYNLKLQTTLDKL